MFLCLAANVIRTDIYYTLAPYISKYRAVVGKALMKVWVGALPRLGALPHPTLHITRIMISKCVYTYYNGTYVVSVPTHYTTTFIKLYKIEIIIFFFCIK